ncbi:transglycosylase SLT domain-containing protein [Nonomuraea rosea]|uniref:Transglycosylase SLT domain-containing protein n=1 Tax=Nonomuraea rosea TaxID=638574 RepID=A0ABP6VE37_9ACTN
MSALDDVRGVPGGAELADLAARVIGDPGAITAAANAWRAAADTAQQQAGAVRTATAEVDDAWQGDSADAFAGYMSGLVGCGDTLQQALRDCAGQLDTAAGALSSAESAALEICGGYATTARAQYDAEPRPTDDQVLQSMQGRLSQAREELKGIADGAGATLADAAGKIQAALSPIPGAVAAVHEPDAQPFAPAVGKPLGWSPAEPDDRSTALAGTTPQSSGSPSFGGYGPSGPPPAGGGPAPQGQVADWINQAITILKAQGYPADKMNPNDIWMIIKHESGGNPNAINNWDSNAAKGTPSKGLMQTIDPTFNRWKLAGHGDIYNPVDNIIAGVRYAVERYGSVSNVPGVVGTKTGGGYRGY